MFKVKYVRNNFIRFIDDSFTDYLNMQAKQGWHFVKMNSMFLKFKKGNKEDIHYSIDFHIPNEEYKDILSQEGFEFVSHYHKIYIYKNNHLNEALHTDEKIKSIDFIDTIYPKSSLYLFPFIILLFLGFYYSIYHKVLCLPFVLGSIFNHFRLYLISFLVFLFIVTQTIEYINILLLRYYFYHIDIKPLKYLSLYRFNTKLTHILSYFLIFVSVIIFFYFSYLKPILILYECFYLCIFLIYYYLINQFANKISNELYRKLFIFVIIILFFIIHFYYSLNIEIPKSTYSHKDPFINQVDYEDYNQEFFSKEYTWYSFTDDECYEDYILCSHDLIAEKIFESKIILFDFYQRSHFHLNQILFEEFYYDDYHYSFQSFSKIKDTLMPIEHISIDQGYYNDSYVFLLKDNQILITTHNQNIQHIIDYYFSN